MRLWWAVEERDKRKRELPFGWSRLLLAQMYDDAKPPSDACEGDQRRMNAQWFFGTIVQIVIVGKEGQK